MTSEINKMAEVKQKTNFIQRFMAVVGPGFITAAVVLGPGSITVSSSSGALMGYSILWTVVVAAIMMITFTRFGAIIGILSNESLLTTAANKYGRWIAILMGISGFLITSGFQTGNNIGVGLAMNALFGGSMSLWAAIFTIVALILIWTSKTTSSS